MTNLESPRNRVTRLPMRLARIGAHVLIRLFGVSPRSVGYRWFPSESLQEYASRTHVTKDQPVVCEQLHPRMVAENPLPQNVASCERLPADPGWWGYSFRDVPTRRCGETMVARVPSCRIVTYIDPGKEFWPVIINNDDRAFTLRETYFLSEMAPLLRSQQVQRFSRGAWILERSYQNYSSWLTAHLPKVLLLQSEGMIDDLLLPRQLASYIESSLRILGIDPDRCQRFDPDVALEVDDLTLFQTDRFRPELLRSVRDAFLKPGAAAPHRRVFISRAKADRRRLLNEDEIWALLDAVGFERIYMEDLTFGEQLVLMAETAVLFALHGAGLTNMLFCSPGTHIVEIADVTFPNPNFYAMAGALGHRYWLVEGIPVGTEHPLYRDVAADTEQIERLLPQLLATIP